MHGLQTVIAVVKQKPAVGHDPGCAKTALAKGAIPARNAA